METYTSLIEDTRDFVKKELENDASGHDWWHIFRVCNTAKTIAQSESADLTVVELAALLHDIGDWKFHNGDESVGPAKASKWLVENDVPDAIICAVCDIIKTLSFKGANVATPMSTLEGKVVQDADRLDAIGAMGIARAFAYGGHHNRLIYHPDQPPELHDSFEKYKSNKGHSINHFYEKLLLLKDRMNTTTGKAMAEERHQFMEQYLNQFFKEWDGH